MEDMDFGLIEILSLNLISIVLRPDRNSKIKPKDNTILGNTCMYGATSGYLYASGHAGERFAVRNSGATTVGNKRLV